MLLAGCQWVFPLEALPSDAPSAPDGPQAVCPPEYPSGQSTGTLRFRFVSNPASWTDAEDSCVSDTFAVTHLATPDSPTKLLAMRAFAMVPEFWVGAARNKLEVEFRTIGKMPLPDFSPLWNLTQPSNTNSNEFAVQVDGNGLNDRSPNITLPYLCECDLQTIDDNFVFD